MGVHLHNLSDWKGSEGGTRWHPQKEQSTQPTIPFPTERKTSAALCLFMFLFALSAPPAHPSPSQPGLPGAELSSHLHPVPSKSVTKKIKKHFLSESRQGGDPAVSLHARGAGTCPAPRPHPAQQRPVPQPSSASPTAPTGQAKGTKKEQHGPG